MEWRETYNSAMREISVMARSFSLKRANGRFDDLQEKNYFSASWKNLFNSFWPMENEKNEYFYFISASLLIFSLFLFQQQRTNDFA